jgi:periplasmic protein TonB
MSEQKPASFIRIIFHHLSVLAGALALTVSFFLVLPLMQAISKAPTADMSLTTMDVANVPPPPPPAEEKQEEEKEQEEEPPKLQEDAAPLDLAQLELALNPGFSGGLGGDFVVDLKVAGGGDKDVDALFSLADLDQKPRVIYQPSPVLTPKVREMAPGTVYILFIVNPEGKVEEPKVQRSDHPVFERPALAAVKKWRFEPGRRNGRPVRFRMRVPITFPRRAEP